MSVQFVFSEERGSLVMGIVPRGHSFESSRSGLMISDQLYVYVLHCIIVYIFSTGHACGGDDVSATWTLK